MKPLGLNHSGYCGETIDIDQVLLGIVSKAKTKGWAVDSLIDSNDLNLVALHWKPPNTRKRFYISTGIHGDEPAGPLAISALIGNDLIPDDVECWVLPCLNPTGFALNRRENEAGIDLNRDYPNPKSLEIQTQIRWLKDKGSFDCAVCLHEDWEAKGFYLYAVNPNKIPCVSGAIFESIEPIFPIDTSEEIEGFSAENGVIYPPLDVKGRLEWPESLYLAEYHAALGYTLETSSDFPLGSRVDALVKAVEAMIRAVSSSD